MVSSELSPSDFLSFTRPKDRNDQLAHCRCREVSPQQDLTVRSEVLGVRHSLKLLSRTALP
jgi:hypothetical protein